MSATIISPNDRKTSSRQPAAGGASVKAALIDAALDLFGQRGYDGTSVRQICARADANVSAVTYYFGGKAGLFDAVCKLIDNEIGTFMGPLIRRVDKFFAQDPRDPDEALDLLCALYGRAIDMLVPDSPRIERWARFIVRIQQNDDVPATEFGQGGLPRLLIGLIGEIRGKESEPTTDAILAQSLFGQILAFRVSRRTALTILNVNEIDTALTERIKAQLIKNVRAVLTASVR